MTTDSAARAVARRLDARAFFQASSYLQYPALLVALAYTAKPMFNGLAGMVEDWNHGLLYAGVAVGLSSMQDPTKTQNKISRKMWENPGKGRLMLCVLSIEALIPIVFGILGTYLSNSSILNQLSLGLVAFGLGMMGLLKTAIEMREHHRLDRRSPLVAHPAQENPA